MTQMKWYHQLGREMLCWIFGHNWKGSWRRRDNYSEAIDFGANVSYRDEQSGNPYFWFSAGWHFKCKRCRIRVRDDDAWHPFYVKLWWMFRSIVIGIRWSWFHYWKYTNRTAKDFCLTSLSSVWEIPRSFTLSYLWDTKDIPVTLYAWVLDVEHYLIGGLSENEAGK